MIFPFLAAILSASDTIFEKTIFARKREKYKLYVPFMFLFAFLIIAVFFYPFLGEIEDGAFAPIPIILLIITILLASGMNLLYYRGFQREDLSEIQPFMAFSPLLTVIIASLVYPDERNIKVIILAIIAGLALVVSHIEKKHIKIDKGIVPIAGAVFLGAIESNIIKELLYFYSPVAMYTIRTGLIALFLFIFIRPSMKKIKKDDGFKKLFVVGLMWVLTMIFTYYGFQIMGVVYTVLILMLAPVLVLLGSYLFLKERKMRKRDILALIIILVCVIAAQLVS